MKNRYAYGQKPSDIPYNSMGLGWLFAVRHLKSMSASGSSWHSHDQIQLLYCIKGEFSYEFRRNSRVTLTAGHFIVIPRGEEHRHVFAIDPAGHRIEMMIAPQLLAKAKYSLFPNALMPKIVNSLLEKANTPQPCSDELSNLFVQIDKLAIKSKSLTPMDMLLTRTIATHILLLCAADTEQRPGSSFESDIVKAAIDWLEANFTGEINITKLAKHIGYSRSRIFGIFKRATGLSPADWIKRRRIKEALELLANTDNNIRYIASNCGFTSAQYFNTVFKQQTGHTPTSWRISIKQNPT